MNCSYANVRVTLVLLCPPSLLAGEGPGMGGLYTSEFAFTNAISSSTWAKASPVTVSAAP